MVSTVAAVELAWLPSQLDGLEDVRQGICGAANFDLMSKAVAACPEPITKRSCDKVAFDGRDIWSKERVDSCFDAVLDLVFPVFGPSGICFRSDSVRSSSRHRQAIMEDTSLVGSVHSCHDPLCRGKW